MVLHFSGIFPVMKGKIKGAQERQPAEIIDAHQQVVEDDEQAKNHDEKSV